MALNLDGVNAKMTADVGEVNLADGVSNHSARLDRQGGLLVSGLHGKYTEQALKGNIFSCANQAAVATTATTAAYIFHFVWEEIPV